MLSGKNIVHVPVSSEEDDLIQRSSKKIKNLVNIFDNGEWPKLGETSRGKWPKGQTFAEKLQGINGNGDNMNGSDLEDALSDDSLSDKIMNDSNKEDSEPLWENMRDKDVENVGGISQEPDNYVRSKQYSWCVVQKPCRQKRGGKEVPAVVRRPDEGGSRFNVLLDGEKEVGGDKIAPVISVVPVGVAEESFVPSFNGGQKYKERKREKKMRSNKNLSIGDGLRRNAGNNHEMKQVKHPRQLVRSEAKSKGTLCIINGSEKEGTNGVENKVEVWKKGGGSQWKDVMLECKMMWSSFHPTLMTLGIREWGLVYPTNSGTVQAFWIWMRPEGLMGKMRPWLKIPWGACSRNILHHVRSVCQGPKPCLLILAKTKAENDSNFCCLERLGYDGLSFVPSVGRFGGIVAMWKSDIISINVLKTDRQFIHLSCKLNGVESLLLTAVYVVPCESLKFSLWQDLRTISDYISSPWVVMGDFNDILKSDERVGGAEINFGRLKKFQDRIQGFQLNDMGFRGPRFTWRGPCTANFSRLYERLDRALANVLFLAAAFECFVQPFWDWGKPCSGA
ncbi:hypothetical protein K1719_036546 [Acacia pycnantha]|nr:hypothetical protein K1719_036546 [Acacia pycnantha]